MKALLAQLVAGHTLTVAQAIEAFEAIMSGQSTSAQTAALLALIQMRGPTVHELVGAAQVMREKVTRVVVPKGYTAIDTCGTGGDHSGTFNISTAAALVTAAAGRHHGLVVAKHGNRAVTSQSGSSQVLEQLGVKLQVRGETLTRCLAEAGICFCFAPAHHPAMKHAAPVRQELGFRTLFNLVGPLTNPAGARRQVIGVFAEDLVDLIAEVLTKLEVEHALVVHGTLPDRRLGPPRDPGEGVGRLDELSTCGPSHVAEVRGGVVRRYNIDPATFGLSYSHPSALHADGPEASATIIRHLLAGEPGPARDIVLLNAAAALWIGGVAKNLSEGLAHATAAINSHAAERTLDTLVQLTQQDAG
jgi:anthranilate phosphoribosyltransferase